MADAVQIARAVAGALDYAHRAGIVHRDIKPENILMHDGLPVVADFGIATALLTAGGARFTATGIAVGTPAYMSPEQVSGDPRLDGRSDLYSLGCVLYEMLAGEPPFSGPSAQAIIGKRFTEPEPRVTAARHDVSREIEGVVCRAMAKDAANRFATGAHDMQERARRGPFNPSPLAWGHCALGELEQAFACFPQMVPQRDAFIVCLPSFSWWDPLRSDPRFGAMLRQLAFPDWSRAVSDSRARALLR